MCCIIKLLGGGRSPPWRRGSAAAACPCGRKSCARRAATTLFHCLFIDLPLRLHCLPLTTPRVCVCCAATTCVSCVCARCVCDVCAALYVLCAVCCVLCAVCVCCLCACFEVRVCVPRARVGGWVCAGAGRRWRGPGRPRPLPAREGLCRQTNGGGLAHRPNSSSSTAQ